MNARVLTNQDTKVWVVTNPVTRLRREDWENDSSRRLIFICVFLGLRFAGLSIDGIYDFQLIRHCSEIFEFSGGGQDSPSTGMLQSCSGTGDPAPLGRTSNSSDGKQAATAA